MQDRSKVMPAKLFKLSFALFSILLLTFASLKFAVALDLNSPDAGHETLSTPFTDSSNSSIASLSALDLGATDPSTITNYTECYPPIALEVNPLHDCYVLIQWYLQQYPFYKNYTLTKRNLPSEKYITVPKGLGYRTCHLTVDMVKRSPAMKVVGSAVADWLWELYEQCLPKNDTSINGGGGTAVDYLWNEGKKVEHNEFKMSFRARRNPFASTSQSSSASATATAIAGVSTVDSLEVETS